MAFILFFIFILGCLYVLREIYLFIQVVQRNSKLIGDAVIPYSVPPLRLIGLWLFLGYIITYLIFSF